MKLAVLGATGRTGMEVVRQALERGDAVQALVRSESKAALLGSHDRLILVEGDLLDAAAVGKVLDGVDAVINVAGHVKGSPKDLQRHAIAVVLAAMRDRGVRRIVTLTGAGVRHPDDRPKFIDKLFGAALRILQRDLLDDSVAYVDVVQASDADWTIVRAPRLTDEDGRGTYRVARTVGADSGMKVSRADLARFILDEAHSGRHVREMPVVSA